MTATHTPGPWSVGELNATGIEIKHGNNVPGAISLVLARVIARQTWLLEAEKNARLISAAPDMLKALQDLEPILNSAESNASGTANWEYVRDAVAAARAAIKKATDGA